MSREWRHAIRALEIALGLCAATALLACKEDIYSTDDRVAALEVPSRSDFKRVADAAQLHCGTLDCHGQEGRNMRFYGQYGYRLQEPDNPVETPTTAAEYDATFWSIVGLEPEIVSKVVRHRSEPGALAMVRKARGVEKHKGGELMTEGDALDRCLIGWLIGMFEGAACTEVIDTPRPQLDGGT